MKAVFFNESISDNIINKFRVVIAIETDRLLREKTIRRLNKVDHYVIVPIDVNKELYIVSRYLDKVNAGVVKYLGNVPEAVSTIFNYSMMFRAVGVYYDGEHIPKNRIIYMIALLCEARNIRSFYIDEKNHLHSIR